MSASNRWVYPDIARRGIEWRRQYALHWLIMAVVAAGGSLASIVGFALVSEPVPLGAFAFVAVLWGVAAVRACWNRAELLSEADEIEAALNQRGSRG